jgi:small subunit ribosomal protein S5
MALKRIKHEHVSLKECGDFNDKTVTIRRVSKVVKGGRRFSFSALVVTGDGRGHVGYGLGKAAEVPDAIRKASEQSRKNLVRVPMRGATIPHEIVGKYGPTTVILKPASPGTGIIAGSVVRSIVDAAGVKDIRTKCIGSNNPHNVLHATLDGLQQLLAPELVARLRGISLDELQYAPY